MKASALLSSILSLFIHFGAFAQTSERSKEIQACMETDQATLVLDVWDAGIEDNDSIRLYLNGKIVADSFRLSKAHQQITLQLEPGSNELSLYALNLGDIPNNTAALSVSGQKKISLSSGLQVSGTLQVLFRAPGLTTHFISCPKNLKPIDDDNEAKLIRSNPQLTLPSYALLQQGIRLNAGESFRKIEVQDCYMSSVQEVDLLLWDCGIEDNDTVSLYLNGEWILRNFRLTKAPFTLPVKLLAGENMLVLYAHNLGDIPKNTAAIAIKNRFSKQEVGMMISDKNTCGAIRLAYGMSDENGNSVPPCLNENVVDSTSEPEIVYMNSIRPVLPPPSGQVAPQNTTTPSNPGTYYPPIIIPNPPRSPRPVPSTSPNPPSPPKGRQPGNNPGGSGRNKPRPNY